MQCLITRWYTILLICSHADTQVVNCSTKYGLDHHYNCRIDVLSPTINPGLLFAVNTSNFNAVQPIIIITFLMSL